MDLTNSQKMMEGDLLEITKIKKKNKKVLFSVKKYKTFSESKIFPPSQST